MKHDLLIALVCWTLMISGCTEPPAPPPVPVPFPAPTPEPVEEKLAYATGLIKPEGPKYGVMFFSPKAAPDFEIPANFSWEDEGFATPVRNQGNCGSCWAFGGTQTLEMGYLIFGGKIIDFSEQELVGKLFYGCGGGYFTGEYQVSKGQPAESDCPYKANNSKCKTGTPSAGKGILYGEVGQYGRTPTTEELQLAILEYGALSVTVGANGSFGSYKGGFAKSCPKVGTNHIVALTGWKTNPEDGEVYFKVKNSWSTSWGEGGYGYFRKGCWNLAEEASWLAVEKVPCPPPAVKLPAEIVLNYGDDIVLAVKEIQKVKYAWYLGDKKLSDSHLLEMKAEESLVLTLKVKNICGEAEIQTKVTVKNP